MTAQRFQQIRSVFERLAGGPEPLREAALGELRERDPELATEVEGLLEAYQRRGDFIAKPVARLPVTEPLPEPPPEPPADKWVGPYHLLELIGQGGMGQVWRAEQTEPLRRIVALKLIRTGMDTREVVRRFESERQALALMEHPAIAKVFDTGSTPQGQPYFAMEYVAGVPITAYCQEHRLGLRDRLRLFVRVCEGVQHAHHKAIIHRDVKPSNILVTEVDGKPLPKIIDFGVSRAIPLDGVEETALTRLGAILGTLEYMSPEQASTTGQDIDTRTDVYSLGVVLYQLLTGVLPFDPRGVPLAQALRRIAEDTPARPSSRMRPAGAAADPATVLCQDLRGDLDAITLRALEKQRSERYGSAAELAADINRYLRHEPVLARPTSLFYLAKKYVRRHRVAVAAGAAMLAMLASFAVWQQVELRQIRRERDRADRIAQFMTDMFRVSDPGESRGNQVTAREILDRAALGIDRGLANDPETQAKLMDLMGRVYYGLGLYSRSEVLLRRSVELRRHVSGPRHPDTAQSMHNLANALAALGKEGEARRLDLEVLDIRRRALGPDHPDTLRTMNSVAVDLVQEGRYTEALQLHQTVYQSRKRVLGPEHPNTLLSMENLGNTLGRQGRYREAEELERGALAIKERTLGRDHPDTLRTLLHLAGTLYEEGRYAQSEVVARRQLAASMRVLGPEHRDTLNAMLSLANPLENLGRLAEAERLDRQALLGQQRILGKDHPDTLLAMNNLAGVLAGEGVFAEAERLDREVLAARIRTLGPEHANTLHSAARLASVLMLGGRLAEARRVAAETRAVLARVLGTNHPETASTVYTLGCIAAREGKTAEALAALREAVDHGLKPNAAAGLGADPALERLRGEPAFRELAEYARRQAARTAW